MKNKLVSIEHIVAKMNELVKNLDAPFSIAVIDLDNFEAID